MAQIWHRRKNRSANADYKELILVARDGIEPPTPAFSGLRSAGPDRGWRIGITNCTGNPGKGRDLLGCRSIRPNAEVVARRIHQILAHTY